MALKDGTGATFQQFNAEINDLHKYLKENKFSDEEIREIFQPLNNSPKVSKLRLCLTLTLILVAIFIYFLTTFETVSWHLSAVARILLIKLIPYWDWTPLKNEKCLISRPQFGTAIHQLPTVFNCDLCENSNAIDTYETVIDEDFLQDRYLDVNTPVVVAKATKFWTTAEDFVENLLADEEIAGSVPCKVATNTHDGPVDVATLLGKAEIFDSFFMHFQNCELEAMKHFRSFTPRPAFLPVDLVPIQYNWMVWSRNYNTTKYKRVDLVEKIAVFGQIRGTNSVRLLPRNNCKSECPEIHVDLREGDVLVFNSFWDLEYKPGNQGENLAAILETR